MTEVEVEELTRQLDHDLIDCRQCPYFQHAAACPSEASTVCPTCGLKLIHEEDSHG